MEEMRKKRREQGIREIEKNRESDKRGRGSEREGRDRERSV